MRVVKPVVSVLALALVAAAGYRYLPGLLKPVQPKAAVAASEPAPKATTVFVPSSEQWANLITQPVTVQTFRAELTTDGKIGIDEGRTTPVFSPYSGVVKRLVAAPGDHIEAGQLLFTVEATDMVQAQNDFIVALDTVHTAESQAQLARLTEQRQRALVDAKASPLKDLQQAQSDLIVAENAKRTAEIGVEAVRNRLRLLKKSDTEIAEFEKSGKINPETPIYAPIAGTVVQRKVGQGQYITSGASDPSGDPVFVIGNLATVWLNANVREADVLAVKKGQDVSFRVLAAPNQTVTAKIDYVADTLDPTSRRLLVRATIDNADRMLKPEMFARVTIFTSEPHVSPAVPREAVIYEGDAARVWVVGPDKSLAMRPVILGAASGAVIQVLSGLSPDDQVLARGALFIDRAASGGDAG